MKKILLGILIAFSFLKTNAQVTTVAGDYKVINIGNDTYGDYTHALILLHQIYNGTMIDHNYAIGTITAMRGAAGAFNRINVVNVNTSSSYVETAGTINSYDDNASWGLKTCIYNGNMYLALDIPYSDAYHNWGYYFSGWTTSTGESMKCVPYMVSGSPVNQTILTNIQDFTSNMVETHNTAGFNITGSVSIGTNNPYSYKLAVNGSAIATSMTVKLYSAWPDYVFKPTYHLPSLTEVKTYIYQNHHLPDMPSEQEVAKDGLNLGEMNKLLTKKVEELTLYLIEKDKQLTEEQKKNELQDARIAILEKQQEEINQLKQQLIILTQALNKN